MNGSRFDAWTRRRFGFAAGGVALSLVGLACRQDAEAKKKNRKKRKRKRKKKTCTNAGQPCTPGGGGSCCGNASCELFDGVYSCCLGGNNPCSSSAECCGKICFEGSCVIR